MSSFAMAKIVAQASAELDKIKPDEPKTDEGKDMINVSTPKATVMANTELTRPNANQDVIGPTDPNDPVDPTDPTDPTNPENPHDTNSKLSDMINIADSLVSYVFYLSNTLGNGDSAELSTCYAKALDILQALTKLRQKDIDGTVL